MTIRIHNDTKYFVLYILLELFVSSLGPIPGAEPVNRHACRWVREGENMASFMYQVT